MRTLKLYGCKVKKIKMEGNVGASPDGLYVCMCRTKKFTVYSFQYTY